ncbi:MAG: gliding motility protein GldC [Saprospiraceae bacterium]|jgi:gliding motility-associated protein GldC|nr:gliding motility protein GldC [Saprospiraceae bacterium]MBK6477831.1 gliding motility protein GldC [Saprospiraceae bacterium]MBK6816293.1 gliding motility protein GldC [Saprospiraceae bacterium]MBK7370407.1 gliding motility protein GldC [Saprospiraceae bacterium]MBK7438115.1 gliding motility protein GldC [Saprospiraceae bacterium]
MNKESNQIILEVTLDEEKIPSAIHWRADDGPEQGHLQEVKAFLLSLYDGGQGDTLKIDLWTKDMQVHEMDRMMYFTLKSLADTYLRATQNKEVATDMRRFSDYFAEKTNIKGQTAN